MTNFLIRKLGIKTAILLIFIMIACVTGREDLLRDKVLSIQKTACYGYCPVYTLDIYKSGLLVLHGEENLDKIGEYHLKISKQEVERLIKKFEAEKFFRFKNSYTSNTNDLPTTFIYFSHNGRQKKIMNYDGAPKALIALQKELEQLLDIPRWKKV